MAVTSLTPFSASWPEDMVDEDQLEEEEEEEDEAISKRLLFEETPMKRDDRRTKKRSVVVFLRIRPKNQQEILSMDASCLHILSPRELQAVAPATSQTFKNKAGVRCPAASSQAFSFSHIFDTQTTQREIFEESMVPTLRDFFEGQNCLVFSYGVTNSGKTYTVTGTPTEPGILPRSLDLIFNSISPQQLSSLQLKPKNFSEVVYLTDEDMEGELARKDNILNQAREMSLCEANGMEITAAELTDDSVLSKVSSNYSKVSDTGTSLDDIQVQDGSTLDLQDPANVCYSVWISFAEVYNEFIYDLLGEESKTRSHRSSLKLAEDRNHNHFIKGLQEVKVGSMEEAMLLLKLGSQQRHVASTRLNYQSSRSHTIFTIKLIKMVNTERPHTALVNRISIVDLAGAERSMKTGASGMRVKEAGNINNSLHTLGKCIEAMRHNQNKRRGDELVVPFRESKLTRLFQNYFVGKGKGVRQGRITMLVNVSNSASVFDETVHVLKFSAITSKVIPVVKQAPVRRATQPPPPTQQPVASAPPPAAAAPCMDTPRPGREGQPTVEEDKTIEAKKTVSVTFCEQCKLAKEECAQLRKRICELEVEKMEIEYNIRQEVCLEFQEQLTQIEETHREELEEQAEDMQEMYEKRMQLLQKSMKKQFNRKRRRIETEEREEGDTEDGERNGERGAVEGRLREKIAELEEQLQEERDRGVTLSSELTDALETHKNQATLLNQQINGLSLEVNEAKKSVKQLQDELTAATERKVERGVVESQLREKIAELEEQLQEERDRGVTLSSELTDALETHKNQVTLLNQQINGLSLEVNEAKKSVKQLQDELTAATETKARETELVSSCESLQRQLDMANNKILEVTGEKECLESERLSLISEYEGREGQLRQEIKRLKADLHQMSESRTDLAAKLDKMEREITATVRDHVERVERADASREDAVAEVEILQARISELTEEMEVKLGSNTPLPPGSAEVTSLQELRKQLETELTSLRGELHTSQEKLTEEQRHCQELEDLMCSETNNLRNDLAAKEEAMKKVETEVQLLQETVDSLQETQEKMEREHKAQLEAVQGDHQLESSSLNTKIQQLMEREEAMQQAHSELCKQLETELTSLRGELHTSQEKLTEEQRHYRELQDLMCSETNNLQNELAAKEEAMKKVETEVQLLQETVDSLQETQEKMEREHKAQLEAVQGDRQLESSSLNTRIQQLMEREEAMQQAHSEEVAQWCRKITALTQDRDAKLVLYEKKVSDLEQELKKREGETSGGEGHQITEDPHIYEETSVATDEPTVYENEGESLMSSSVLQSLDNHPDRLSTSVHLTHSDSKPVIAVLERSSQLVEDTFTEAPSIIIDATPPIAKRGRGMRKKAKRTIDGDGCVTPEAKKGKYQLRNRKKHQRFAEDENRTPTYKAPSLRSIITRSTKKIAALSTQSPSSQVNHDAVSPSSPGPAPRTARRTRKAHIRKSQISAPLGLDFTAGPTIPVSRAQVPLGMYLTKTS